MERGAGEGKTPRLYAAVEGRKFASGSIRVPGGYDFPVPVLLLKDPQTARDYEVANPQPVAYSEGAIYPLRMLPSQEPLTAEIFGFLAKRAGARLYTGTVPKANVLTALGIAPLSDDAQGIFFGEMEAGSPRENGGHR
ncbi:MAG: hypothetical protein M3436_13580 [Pseudomonadota bacterium]|nr:hypothetical protein [Pseudomonadota bacterium]